MVQGWTLLETSLGSIARLKDFQEDVKPEDEDNKPEPDEHWPNTGVIEFRNVTAAHNPSAIALHDVSLTVESGQKVGICGRTGSGKSSFVGTILGLLEVTAGKVFIDGMDLAAIQRDTVRERLITIPQDPLILIGSVRLNADPAGSNDDDAIITALTKVGLWGVLSERGGLDAEITASSLSKGQQQLLALARALLKKGKILILDEPTSNVDAETDGTMQRILREDFADCTILTVAHRLNTIIDSDIVMVMDAGRLAEVGSPQKLLKVKDSLFSKLAKSSGAGQE
ncbi:putative abc transporter protein [Phaeoacremonium minimum UCRPA7]|uniref:Putative abc transporter protein n=1 Tax=Phaeoacremonium minimum (strain UCR-PA7) TaxID=1286976 RepID=R8B8R6_PHAM7|nr:putative abc transporter protein [Phaeoacremonium minimum UCRPA7]EON95700.1 putative abc transporter protein [Phaeoacremonium minimum UCRPA7]